MSIRVDVAVAGVRLGMSRALADRAARAALRTGRVLNAEISIAFVDNRTIAALNRRHLGRRGSTDVIAFGFGPLTAGGPLVGDVYIGRDVARQAARERRIRLREELVRLVVHGTLHVMGHDHPDGDARMTSTMWRVQERIVARVMASERP